MRMEEETSGGYIDQRGLGLTFLEFRRERGVREHWFKEDET